VRGYGGARVRMLARKRAVDGGARTRYRLPPSPTAAYCLLLTAYCLLPHYCLLPTAYAATSTLIVRGFASSRNGSFTVSTPFLYSALTLVASTVLGSVNDRTNSP
jgi:hypothetical protein